MTESGELARQLTELGVERGSVLVVHTAFSQVSPLAGGPDALIDALLAHVGEQGTLVMPSMSDDDDHVFDAQRTPCVGMGIVAERFWRRAGVLRSDSPHAFAAQGPRAAQITAPHPIDVPHGLDSPIGRAYELDAQVLLIGVGHDANTTVHLAENMAAARYLVKKHATVLRAGEPAAIEYEELDHCCQRFAELDEWLEYEGQQRRGLLGSAEARVMRARHVVTAALAGLIADEFVFLHASGECADCDLARAAAAAH